MQSLFRFNFMHWAMIVVLFVIGRFDSKWLACRGHRSESSRDALRYADMIIEVSESSYGYSAMHGQNPLMLPGPTFAGSLMNAIQYRRRCIPKTDYCHPGVRHTEAKDAKRSRTKQEMLSVEYRQPDPSCSQSQTELAMGE